MAPPGLAGYLAVSTALLLRRGQVVATLPGQVLILLGVQLGEVTIGRGHHNPGRGPNVQIYSPLVARRHCRIVCKDTMAVLVDLKSTNGVWLNQARVSSPRVLHQRDRIHVGDESFFYYRTLPAGALLVSPCPECRNRLRVVDSEAGVQIVCHGCGGMFSEPTFLANALSADRSE